MLLEPSVSFPPQRCQQCAVTLMFVAVLQELVICHGDIRESRVLPALQLFSVSLKGLKKDLQVSHILPINGSELGKIRTFLLPFFKKLLDLKQTKEIL